MPRTRPGSRAARAKPNAGAMYIRAGREDDAWPRPAAEPNMVYGSGRANLGDIWVSNFELRGNEGRVREVFDGFNIDEKLVFLSETPATDPSTGKQVKGWRYNMNFNGSDIYFFLADEPIEFTFSRYLILCSLATPTATGISTAYREGPT